MDNKLETRNSLLEAGGWWVVVVINQIAARTPIPSLKRGISRQRGGLEGRWCWTRWCGTRWWRTRWCGGTGWLILSYNQGSERQKQEYMQYKVLKFESQLVWKVPTKTNSFAGQNSFLDSPLSSFRKLFSLPSQEQSLQCVIFHHFKFFLFLFFWQSGNTPIFLSGARNSKIISPIFLENGALAIVGFVGFQTLQ